MQLQTHDPTHFGCIIHPKIVLYTWWVLPSKLRTWNRTYTLSAIAMIYELWNVTFYLFMRLIVHPPQKWARDGGDHNKQIGCVTNH